VARGESCPGKGIPGHLSKIAFSTTLAKVVRNARPVRDGFAETVAKLKEQPGKDRAVGGAGLASTAIKLGVVDEYPDCSSARSSWAAARRIRP